MGRNLHISYDLYAPGKNYDAVINTIKSLGSWAKIHKSCWYVNSAFTSDQAVQKIWAVMDPSDTVYVVDATNNVAHWQNISPEAARHIQDQWFK